MNHRGRPFGVRALLLAAFAALILMLSAAPAQAAPGDDGVGSTGTSDTVTSACGSDKDTAAPNDEGSTALGGVAGVVSQGAITALCWATSWLHIENGPTPQLHQGNGGWFDAMYTMFRSIALWVVIPVLMMATIHSVFKGSLALILKIYFVYLPVSIVGGVIAVGITQLLLTAVDDFTAGFANNANEAQVFAGVVDGFGTHGLAYGIPFFVLILSGLFLIVACIAVYIVLIMREASIYIATAFIPLSLVFFIWPSTAHFFKKLFEFLMAMIFSKLIMVAGISLAVAAMASTAGGQHATTGADGSSVRASVLPVSVPSGVVSSANDNTASPGEPWYTWLGQTMTTTVMFGIVAFAPNLVTKLMAQAGAPSMGREIAEHANRPGVMRHVALADRWQGNYAMGRQLKETKRTRKGKQEWARNTSAADVGLAAIGVERGADGTYAIDDDALNAAGIGDPVVRTAIKDWSASQDPNAIAAAHYAFEHRADRYHVDPLGHTVLVNSGKNEALILTNVVDPHTGKLKNGVREDEMAPLLRSTEIQFNAGFNVRVVVPHTGIINDNNTGDAMISGAPAKGHLFIDRESKKPREQGVIQRLRARTIQYNANHPGANRRVHVVVDATTNVRDRMRAGAYSTGTQGGENDY